MERLPDPCIRVQNDLALFVGGELERGTLREFARHLEACAACRTAHARALAAHGALARGLDLAPGPDLWPALREKLVREGLVRSPAVQTERAPVTDTGAPQRVASVLSLRGARGAWIAAAAAAVVLFSAWGVRAWLDQCLPDGGGSGASGELVVEPRHIEPRVGGALVGQPTLQATPVSDGRLHRLSTREGSLLDGAMVLGSEEPVFQFDLQPARPRNEQPAGLVRWQNGW